MHRHATAPDEEDFGGLECCTLKTQLTDVSCAKGTKYSEKLIMTNPIVVPSKDVHMTRENALRTQL